MRFHGLTRRKLQNKVLCCTCMLGCAISHSALGCTSQIRKNIHSIILSVFSHHAPAQAGFFCSSSAACTFSRRAPAQAGFFCSPSAACAAPTLSKQKKPANAGTQQGNWWQASCASRTHVVLHSSLQSGHFGCTSVLHLGSARQQSAAILATAAGAPQGNFLRSFAR